MRWVPIVIIVAVLAASVVVITSSEGSTAYPEIFAWPTCGEEGELQLTDYSEGMATFRAIPSEGWAVGTWTDGSQKIIGTTMVITLDATTAGDVYLNFIQAYTKLVSLRWVDHDGSSHTYTTTIDSDDFYKGIASNTIRNSTSVHPVPDLLLDDPCIDDIAAHIRGISPEASGEDLADMIMHFVQDSISYSSDMTLYGSSEWWAYPTETLFNGSGDCEDTTILFVAIAARMGLVSGFVTMPSAGHMAAGVVLDTPGTFIAGTDDVIYVETATDGRMELGRTPSQSVEGAWTPVTWSSGFIIGETVPIGTASNDSLSNYRTGHITTEPFVDAGGNWNNGSRAGVGYANSNDSMSNANANNGARLTIRHQNNHTDHSDGGLTSRWNDKKNLSVPVGSASTIEDPTARDMNEGRWSS